MSDISKYYGSRPVLDHFSHSFERGHFSMITGPSGSGKSTLLYLIGLLDDRFTGEYILFGRNIRRMSDREKSTVRNTRIGFIFQNFHLIPHLNVRDNILLASIYRTDTIYKNISDRYDHLIRLLGISDIQGKVPCELSGGQQQRVAAARALLENPDLILADEPTGNLDPSNTGILMDLFIKLKQQGKTIIMVTHDPSLFHYSDHLIEL